MQALVQKSLAGRPVGISSRRATNVRARSSVVVQANDKPLWYPGAKAPEYLDVNDPGYYGFDPLRLGEDANSFRWYRAAEKYNGRFAMMAVPGILLTDAAGLPDWWVAGGEADLGPGLVPLIVIEAGIFAVLESFRFNNWKNGGTMDGIGPIQPFDPLGMTSADKEKKELKNGRLAMIAFLGFASQAAVRGLGPIECLKLHLENPGYNNIFTSAVGPEVTAAVVGLSIAPMIIQARRTISPDGDKDVFKPIPGPW